MGIVGQQNENCADPKVKNTNSNTPWDLEQENDKLKDTKSYWALNEG
jgi:hypothetical protein